MKDKQSALWDFTPFNALAVYSEVLWSILSVPFYLLGFPLRSFASQLDAAAVVRDPRLHFPGQVTLPSNSEVTGCHVRGQHAFPAFSEEEINWDVTGPSF